MRCVVVSPEQGFFDGPADAVSLPGFDGRLEVYPGHAPRLLILEAGTVKVRRGRTESEFYITGGYADISPEAVIIPAEDVRNGGSDDAR